MQMIRHLAAGLPDYFVCMFEVNARAAGVPSSRPRLFVVGVDMQAVELLSSPLEWHSALQTIFTAMRG